MARHVYSAVFAFIAATWCVVATGAEREYPRKPIRLIVPFVPGSGTDLLARTIAEPLTASWGQQVVVDNRPGAGGTIGSKLAAAATPDGHTLLLANVAALALAPAMYSKSGYDPVRDFAAVTQMTSTANCMVVHPSVGLLSARDLPSFTASTPLRFASGGNGTVGHLAGELLRKMTKADLVHVPYPGSPAALRDLLAGRVHMSFTSLVSTLPHVKSGKLRAIAVTSLERVRVLPDIPTLDESGVKGFEVSGWQGVVVPAGTSRTRIHMLQQAIAEIIKASEVSARLSTGGLDVVATSPEAFGRYLKSENVKWGTLIRTLGVSVE